MDEGPKEKPLPRHRLDSWKAIAAYLNRGCKTAQRWHTLYGLPVHQLGEKSTSVFAYAEELEEWMKSRREAKSPQAAESPRSAPLFKDTDQDEIRRLRQIIARLEETKGARVVTVEWERQEGYGYLFYITAPTTASEEVFGIAMTEMIVKAFRVIGANLRPDVVAGDHIAPPRIQPERAGCYLKEVLGRWIIVNAADRGLAWSGSRWVSHKNGMPTGGVQISNFEVKLEAFQEAEKAGLRPVLNGFCTDATSITCFQCGMTSYNENDVRERYCGNCRVFLEGGATEERTR